MRNHEATVKCPHCFKSIDFVTRTNKPKLGDATVTCEFCTRSFVLEIGIKLSSRKLPEDNTAELMKIVTLERTA